MMRIRMKMILICLVLADCLVIAGCTAKPQENQTEAAATSPLSTEATHPMQIPETVPALDVDILRQVAGGEGIWVEFYQNEELLRRFWLYSTSNLYWEDNLTYVAHPQTSPSLQYIRFIREDGTAELAVYSGSPDLVRHIQDGEENWFSAKLQEDSAYSLFNLLKQSLSGYLRNSYGRLSFAWDGSAEQVMEYYVATAYPEYARLINRFTQYGFTDYAPLDWKANEITANRIVGNISYAVCYDNPQMAAGLIIDGGTEALGTGEYEGWHIIERQVILEKHADNLWYEVDNNDYLAAISDDGRLLQSTPEAIANAEEFLMSAEQQVQVFGADIVNLAELTDLFLRTANAVAVTGNDTFDWSWICTEDAVKYMGMQSLLNCPAIFYSKYQPSFVFMEEDYAIVYHYEAVVYYRHIDGKWFVDDIVRPFAGT